MVVVRAVKLLTKTIPTTRFNTCVRFYSVFTDIRTEIERFDSKVSVSAAHTPPGSWYVRPDIYELEKMTVFNNNWVAVPGAEHINSPGDFITGFLCDEPYLITKNQSNQLEYFYNICRHHGNLLCDEHQGQAKEFVCPYHAWTYSLDGKLTKATRLRSIENFKAKNYGLNRYSGTRWFGMFFLNQIPGKDPSELNNALSDLKSKLEQIGCREDNLVHVGTKVFPQLCNWKVVIDNYLDGGYHVPICHRDLSGLLQGNSYTIEAFSGYSIQSSQGSESTSRVGSGVLYAHIYPNLFINRYGNWLDVNYVMPTGPETCDIVFNWYYDKDLYNGMDEKEQTTLVEKGIKDSVQVQDEDTEICERVQKGMRSRSYEYGRYAPLVEHLMYDFHCQLQGDYMKAIK